MILFVIICVGKSDLSSIDFRQGANQETKSLLKNDIFPRRYQESYPIPFACIYE